MRTNGKVQIRRFEQVTNERRCQLEVNATKNKDATPMSHRFSTESQSTSAFPSNPHASPIPPPPPLPRAVRSHIRPNSWTTRPGAAGRTDNRRGQGYEQVSKSRQPNRSTYSFPRKTAESLGNVKINTLRNQTPQSETIGDLKKTQTTNTDNVNKSSRVMRDFRV